jgi:predicted DNA-binding transcriptional regulator AlpA
MRNEDEAKVAMTTKHLSAGELVDRPDRLVDVDVDRLSELLVKLTTATALVAARLHTTPQGKIEDDRLLNVAEAAAMLGRSPDWLYRHAKALPFVRRLGGSVMFSRQGLQKYLDRLPQQ